MADAQQIIQDMEKFSKVKKPGFYDRVAQIPDSIRKKLGTLHFPTPVVEPSSITISAPPASVPDEIKGVIDGITNSPVFNQTTLESLKKSNPAMVNHIAKFAQSINRWLVDDFNKISGEKNDFNTQYASWAESGNNFLTIVKEYEKTVSAVNVIEQTEKPVESVVGPETEVSKDSRLMMAFTHMGMDIIPDPKNPGQYTIRENPYGGFPYKDSQGRDKVYKISQEATQAFIDNYLKSPDRDTIDISPKGLFTYFIQQELIGTTSKRKLDPELLQEAQNLFSENSTEWEALDLSTDTMGMLRNASIVAYHTLNINTLESLPTEEGASYTSELSGKQADTLVNRWRIRKLEKDTDRVVDESEAAIDANQMGIDNVYARYEQVIEALKVKASSYPKDKVPAMLTVDIVRMQEKLDHIKAFASNITVLYTQAQNGAFKDVDKGITQDPPSDITSFMQELHSNLDFDFTSNQITLKGDLPWISKEQFDEFIVGRTLENQQENQQSKQPRKRNSRKKQSQSQQESTVLPDVLGQSFDLEFENGLSFQEVINQDALQHRTKAFIQNPPNVVADWYEQFKEARKKHPQLTGVDFIKGMQQSLLSNNPDAKLEDSLGGFTNLETLANTFDLMTAKEADPNSKSEGYAESPNAAAIRNRAGVLYYHIDMVSQAIAADPALMEEYDNGTPEDKKRIFGEVYSQLKADKKLDNPKPEAINDAGARWRHYALLANEQRLWMDCSNTPECAENKTNNDFMSVLSGIMSKDNHMLEAVTQSFAEQGKPIVDYDELEQQKDPVRFGDLYPREIPAFKIAKDLQPFNIKAGQKFLDQVINAFADVMVKDPWDDAMRNQREEEIEGDFDDLFLKGIVTPGDVKKKAAATAGLQGADKTGNDGPTAGDGVIPEVPVFDGLDDNQVQNRVAMMAVGMGVNSILDQLDLGQDVDAAQVRNAMNYMTMMGVEGQPKIQMGDQEIILSDAMQRVFINEFATGAKSAQEASASIGAIVSQLDPKSPLVPMVQSMSVLMGTLSPAEIIQMLSMTSEKSEVVQGESVSIELGSKLTKEDIDMFRNMKNMDQIRDMIEQSEMYDQATIQRIFEAGNEMRNPEAGLEIR